MYDVFLLLCQRFQPPATDSQFPLDEKGFRRGDLVGG
jgi:hypothetical protein